MNILISLICVQNYTLFLSMQKLSQIPINLQNNQYLFQELIRRVTEIATSAQSPSDKLLHICELMRYSISNYDWVGFYLVNPHKANELILAPYCGAPTDHTHIPFGTGICGQAASTLQTFIIEDVTAQTNYLACSLNVKSEIVVPIFYQNTLIGELDIDSHKASAFNKDDDDFLKKVGEICAETIGEYLSNLFRTFT